MAYEPQFDLGWRLPSGLLQEIRRNEEWLLFSSITINGEYKLASEYLTRLNKPVTFLDLGANVGFATWQFANALLRNKQPFKALLVEANPDTFEELQRRIKNQNFGSNIIVPICGLVGKLDGKALLRIDGCHTISKVYAEPNEGGFYIGDLSYIDLEDYLDNEPIDLIKCDIEESEWDFVTNYSDLLKRTGAVIMEIHKAKDEPNKLYEALFLAGFNQRSIIKVEGNVSTEMFTRLGGLPATGSSAPTV